MNHDETGSESDVGAMSIETVPLRDGADFEVKGGSGKRIRVGGLILGFSVTGDADDVTTYRDATRAGGVLLPVDARGETGEQPTEKADVELLADSSQQTLGVSIAGRPAAEPEVGERIRVAVRVESSYIALPD